MKRMTAKQIEVEAGRIFGKPWKTRKKEGTLTEQLQAAIADAEDLPSHKLDMAKYLIECTGDEPS